MDEIITLVDEKDNVIGQKPRSKLIDSDRWRAVEIWVEDTDGNILLAKRSPLKKHEPNVWEPGAAGTVTYPEPYETSSARELGEELGIKVQNLTLEKVLFYKKPFGNRAMGLFRVVVDKGVKLKLQEDEVTEVKWISLKELKEDYRNNPEKYVSDLGIFIKHFACQ
jgi:isopentenyl-diphosphate delta-isomerase